MALIKCAYQNASFEESSYVSQKNEINKISIREISPPAEPSMGNIDVNLRIDDLTNGAIRTNADGELYWNGNEILDKLLNVLGDNLKIQYDNGRIVGNDYSQVYARMMELAVTQAIHWVTTKKELLLKKYEVENQVKLQYLKVLADVGLANSKNYLDSQIQKANLLIADAKNSSDNTLANKSKKADIATTNSKNSTDTCLQNNKLELEEKKVESDIRVANRQIAGFDDNLVIKLLQAELDAFALIYSSGMLDNPDLGPLNVTNLNMAWTMLVNRVHN